MASTIVNPESLEVAKAADRSRCVSAAPHLSLAPTAVSPETIEACRMLYESALRGEIIGLAVVAMLPGNRFFVDAAGEAVRDPTLTRGKLLSLDDALRELVAARREGGAA